MIPRRRFFAVRTFDFRYFSCYNDCRKEQEDEAIPPELKAKSERLNELNAMLNLDKIENKVVDGERAGEEPSRTGDDRER